MKSFVKFRSKQSRRRQAGRFSPWQSALERLESRSLLSATITAPAAQTTLEDTAKAISGMLFTSSIDPVTVTLSVTNGTLTLNSGVAGGVTAAQISGNGTSSVSVTANVSNVNTTLAHASGLTYTPSLNFNGSDTLAININNLTDSANATAALTVTAVNDAPSFSLAPTPNQIVLEDLGAQTVASFATLISAGPNDSGQTVDFQLSNDKNSLFSAQPAISATGTLTYTPAANQNGTATVTVLLHDNGGSANGGVDTSATQTFTITITAVNDAPSFTKGPNQGVLEDAAAQSIPIWATNINAGTFDGVQAVDFQVTNDNPLLFSVAPAVSPTGTLTFTPAANQNGTATVTVLIHDDGGTANGGQNTSATQTFTISITAVNDVPYFFLPPLPDRNQTILEDLGAQTVAGFATGINAGLSDSGQTVDFQLNNDKNVLFSAQPAISATGTLTYTPAANQNGTATVTVLLHDNGGSANGGVDTSATQTFTITIIAVNDAPSFTKGPNQSVLEDAAAQTILNWATNINAGTFDLGQTVDFQVTNDSPVLFSVAPAVSPTGTLTFTPAANQNGTANVTVLIHDDGGTANGGQNTSVTQTFTITVTAVNDAPSFTMGPNQKLLATTAAQTFASFAMNISAGPFESTQTVDFIVNNDRPGLFTTQPVIAANGTLTYTPSGAVGVAVVSVRIHDNGGQTNGGVDTNPTLNPLTPALTFTITISASATGPVVSTVPNPVYRTPAGAKLRAVAVDGLLIVQINGVPQKIYEPSSVTGTLTILGSTKNDEIDLSGLSAAYPGTMKVVINGGAGNDRIVGSFANDSIDGGAGNDTLSGGEGDDTLIGNAGTDLLVETATPDLTLDDTSLTGLGTDKLVTLENASFTADDVGRVIDASAFTRGAVTLIGGAGNDELTGGSKNDAISGRDGNDVLAGGDGNDTVLGGFGLDFLDGNGGNDLLIGGFDDDLIDGGAGQDTAVGGNGGSARGGDGVADAGDAIMHSEVISEAFKKLFAFE